MAKHNTRTQYLSIPDEHYERLKHYKNEMAPRKFVWIKLYHDLLRNWKYLRLPDASKAHFVNLMLLATTMDNRIPFDPDFLAHQIGATEEIDFGLLIREGFLISIKSKRAKRQVASKSLAKSEQVASLDKKREEETRKDEEQDSSSFHSEKKSAAERAAPLPSFFVDQADEELGEPPF